MGNIGEERILVSVVEDVYGWPGGQGSLYGQGGLVWAGRPVWAGGPG